MNCTWLLRWNENLYANNNRVRLFSKEETEKYEEYIKAKTLRIEEKRLDMQHNLDGAMDLKVNSQQ